MHHVLRGPFINTPTHLPSPPPSQRHQAAHVYGSCACSFTYSRCASCAHTAHMRLLDDNAPPSPGTHARLLFQSAPPLWCTRATNHRDGGDSTHMSATRRACLSNLHYFTWS